MYSIDNDCFRTCSWEKWRLGKILIESQNLTDAKIQIRQSRDIFEKIVSSLKKIFSTLKEILILLLEKFG